MPWGYCKHIAGFLLPKFLLVPVPSFAFISLRSWDSEREDCGEIIFFLLFWGVGAICVFCIYAMQYFLLVLAECFVIKIWNSFLCGIWRLSF